MKLLNRFRDREIVRTNNEGALANYRRGEIVTFAKGDMYRVTRIKHYPTEPWSTFVVYGIPVSSAESG